MKKLEHRLGFAPVHGSAVRCLATPLTTLHSQWVDSEDSRLAPPSRVVSDEKGWWEGDDGPEEENDGSIGWKLNVLNLIQFLPIVGTAIWIIVEIL